MRKYAIVPLIIGNQYSIYVSYSKYLKILEKSFPYSQVPEKMEEIIKDLAMELAEKDNIII